MNPLHELLLTRRTTHDYVSAPLPEGALERALEAARWAPNHKLTNPWRFTVFGPLARLSLAKLAASLKAPGAPEDDPAAAKVFEKFMAPAHLLLVSQALDPDPARAHEDYAAIACAIHNMTLSLHAEGVGSKWSTGAITRHEQVLALAGCGPQERSCGLLWVGYAAKAPPKPPRAPLEQIVRHVP